MSLWDTFRAAHPLYTIVTPEQNQAFIRSLLRKTYCTCSPEGSTVGNATGSG